MHFRLILVCVTILASCVLAHPHPWNPWEKGGRKPPTPKGEAFVYKFLRTFPGLFRPEQEWLNILIAGPDFTESPGMIGSPPIPSHDRPKPIYGHEYGSGYEQEHGSGYGQGHERGYGQGHGSGYEQDHGNGYDGYGQGSESGEIGEVNCDDKLRQLFDISSTRTALATKSYRLGCGVGELVIDGQCCVTCIRLLASDTLVNNNGEVFYLISYREDGVTFRQFVTDARCGSEVTDGCNECILKRSLVTALVTPSPPATWGSDDLATIITNVQVSFQVFWLPKICTCSGSG